MDFSHQMKWLTDEAYPNATVIRVVLDNLNVHAKSSPTSRSHRRRAPDRTRLEFHFTPKTPPQATRISPPQKRGSAGLLMK